MTSVLDPAVLSPEQRLAEVAVILARGYTRTLLTKSDDKAGLANGERNQLALLDSVEPSCANAVNSRENEDVA